MADRMFDVSAFAYAHRGLWGGNRVPENSLAAFHSAREHGVGMELDVRLSADGVVHVFHDFTLERMCGLPAQFDSLTAEQLSKAFLPNGFPVPTLEDALDVAGEAPVLIELKVDGPAELAEKVARAVDGRAGRLAVMSFDEATVAQLCQLVTDRPVGLLVPAELLIGADGVRAKAAMARSMGCDYIAPHLSSLALAEEAGGSLPMAAWTLRDPVDLESARRHSAAPIFEGFDAALVREIAGGLAMPPQTPV
jgi:glycerophosphoryl diester phosphodiesterase